jgi:hypothetical protein
MNLSTGLWRAMLTPPTTHPLFRRAYLAPEQPFPWYIGCVQWVGVALFLPVIAFAGLVYSLGWSVGISNLIAKERTQGTFDLLSLSPPGALGVSWAIAIGYLYHHRTFRNINMTDNLYPRVLMAGFVIAGLGFIFDDILRDPVPVAGLLLVAMIVTVALALYADHVQSVVLALVIGMVSPGLAGNRLNAQLYAFTLFIAAQLATYLFTFMVGFVILGDVLRALNIEGEGVKFAVLAVRLVLFVGIREVFIALLWRLVRQHVNADDDEVTFFERGGLGKAR